MSHHFQPGAYIFDIGLISPLFNLNLEIVYLFSIHTNPFYGKNK